MTPTATSMPTATPEPTEIPTEEPTPTWTPEPDSSSRVDALIAVDGTPEADFVGDDIYNEDGQDQTVNSFATPSRKATFLAQIQNEGDSDARFLLKSALSQTTGWQVHYFLEDTGDEIPVSIETETGWQTPLIEPGNSIEVRIEITPDTDVRSNDQLVISLLARTSDFACDVVKAIATRSSRVDALIGVLEDHEYVGHEIYNETGANQTIRQSVADSASNTMNFAVQVRNDANVAVPIRLKAPAENADWTIQYFDALEQGNEITTDITSSTGWVTPTVEPGQTYEIRFQVSPNTTASATTSTEFAIRAEAADSSTEADVVKASVGIQNIAALLYSLDQGETWQTVDADHAIWAHEGVVFGLRATKTNPSLPWPIKPHLMPSWNKEGYILYGETTWYLYETTSSLSVDLHSISAECGNTKMANIRVLPSYSVVLSSSTPSVHVEGQGESSQATLTATVKRNDGTLAEGVSVRFSATLGSINGVGTGDDTQTTDSNGVVTVTFNAGTVPGTAIVTASVLEDSTTGGSDDVHIGITE